MNDFVEWVKQQDFYENTTIVIAGDHCSMDPNFYGDLSYDKHHGEVERKIYNAIIHPAVRAVPGKVPEVYDDGYVSDGAGSHGRKN